MKKFFALIALSVLCGCSYNAHKPQTQQEQICSELKRDIVFDTASTPSTGSASSTQYAEMLRRYDKNGCNNLENK